MKNLYSHWINMHKPLSISFYTKYPSSYPSSFYHHCQPHRMNAKQFFSIDSTKGIAKLLIPGSKFYLLRPNGLEKVH